MDRPDTDTPRGSAPLRASLGPRAWRRAALDTLLARIAKAPAAWQWFAQDGRLSRYGRWPTSSAAARGTGGDTGRDALGRTSHRAAIATRGETSAPVTARLHAAGASQPRETPRQRTGGAPQRTALLEPAAGTSVAPEPLMPPRRRPAASAPPAAFRRLGAAPPPIARAPQGPATIAPQAEAELRASPRQEEGTLPPARPARRHPPGHPGPEGDRAAPIAALPGATGGGPTGTSLQASFGTPPHRAPAGHAASLAEQRRLQPMALRAATPGIGAAQSRRRPTIPAKAPLSPVSLLWPPETAQGRPGVVPAVGALPAERPLGSGVPGAPPPGRAGLPGRLAGDAGPTPASTRGPLGVPVGGLDGHLWGPERAVEAGRGPILLRQEIVLRDEEGNTRRRLENDARWELYADGYR